MGSAECLVVYAPPTLDKTDRRPHFCTPAQPLRRKGRRIYPVLTKPSSPNRHSKQSRRRDLCLLTPSVVKDGSGHLFVNAFQDLTAFLYG